MISGIIFQVYYILTELHRQQFIPLIQIYSMKLKMKLSLHRYKSMYVVIIFVVVLLDAGFFTQEVVFFQTGAPAELYSIYQSLLFAT